MTRNICPRLMDSVFYLHCFTNEVFSLIWSERKDFAVKTHCRGSKLPEESLFSTDATHTHMRQIDWHDWKEPQSKSESTVHLTPMFYLMWHGETPFFDLLEHIVLLEYQYNHACALENKWMPLIERAPIITEHWLRQNLQASLVLLFVVFTFSVLLLAKVSRLECVNVRVRVWMKK
jgi:hypothetical protein